MPGTGKFAHIGSLTWSILKVFGTYLTYSFFWKFWYHVISSGHKLWLERARSCKWLALDMILLKQSSRNLSCTIFMVQNTSQVFLIGSGDNSWYRWDHTLLALSVVFWKYLWLLYFWDFYNVNLSEKSFGRSTAYSCRTNIFLYNFIVLRKTIETVEN